MSTIKTWQERAHPLRSDIDCMQAEITELRAALAQTEPPAQGEWHHCSPELLASGVDCATTKRRDCVCEHGGSHDHFITALLQSKPAEPVNQVLLDALEEYRKAGVGNSTDWRIQLSALRMATAAIAQAQPAKREPLSEARIIELNDTAFDKYITQDARAIDLARAIEAEITKGQQ